MARIKSAFSVGITLVVALCYALPLLYLVLAAFKSNSDILNHPASLIFEPTLEAFRVVFSGAFVRSVWNSFVIASGTTLLTISTGAPLAYVLARARAGWTGVVIGALVALQMTPAATSVIPLFSVLAALGLLGSTVGVVLAMSATALPYAVLLMRPFFVSVPREVEDAAQVDGATVLGTFTRVVLPLARNGVSLIAVLVFVAAWGEFLFPMSFLNDGSKQPISVLIAQQQSIYGTKWNALMALALMGALPTIVLFTVIARRLTSGLSLGMGK